MRDPGKALGSLFPFERITPEFTYVPGKAGRSWGKGEFKVRLLPGRHVQGGPLPSPKAVRNCVATLEMIPNRPSDRHDCPSED